MAKFLQTDLNPDELPDETVDLLRQFELRIIGQDRAIEHLVKIIMRYRAGLAAPNRPLAALLFLGPTGVGKTEVVRALAEILLGSKDALLRIDCQEYQHGHEISKLFGSPPGYVGYRETPRLSQWKLEAHSRKKDDGTLEPNILLLDEIEKAHPDFHNFLLGILDTGRAVLGNSDPVDMTKSIIVMTSNLGARDMNQESEIGFHHADRKEVDSKVYEIGREAARKFFAPEFRNRIDKTIVFRTLGREALVRILAITLADVSRRLYDAKLPIFLDVSDKAKEFLLREGTSEAYGARELRRVVERFIVDPIANFVNRRELNIGDRIQVDFDEASLTFSRLRPPWPPPLLLAKPSPSDVPEQEKAAA